MTMPATFAKTWFNTFLKHTPTNSDYRRLLTSKCGISSPPSKNINLCAFEPGIYYIIYEKIILLLDLNLTLGYQDDWAISWRG